jgi:hypothetical protein
VFSCTQTATTKYQRPIWLPGHLVFPQKTLENPESRRNLLEGGAADGIIEIGFSGYRNTRRYNKNASLPCPFRPKATEQDGCALEILTVFLEE